MKIPQTTKQSLLTLKPDLNVMEAHDVSQVGIIGTWKFDQESVKHALAQMIIVDELPFKFVEGIGFQKFVNAACPLFKIPSRMTVNRDCYKFFLSERLKLKAFVRSHCQRISITTDCWTSIQRINYMCVTAHFVDDGWNLQKKIISFVLVTSHKGEQIAKALENYLPNWGIKNVFSITVDNASSNDVTVGFLKKI